MSAALIVIAKAPVPGRSEDAAVAAVHAGRGGALAEAALRRHARRGPGDAGRPARARARGPGRRWLPRRLEVIAQRGGGLDERLASAFEDVGGPALLVGMDTPQVTPASSPQACVRLGAGTDAVLGPAPDGGYWAHRPAGAATRAASRRADEHRDTCRAQLARLRRTACACAAAGAARRRPDRRRSRGRRPCAQGALRLGARATGRMTARRLFGAPRRRLASPCARRRGRVPPLAVDGWLGLCRSRGRACARGARGPVLDVGCGPGRHVGALARRGVLGGGGRRIPGRDPPRSPPWRGGVGAVDLRSPPGRGQWGTALLLDGNIGIGGDRTAAAPTRRTAPAAGEVLVELERPGGGLRPIAAAGAR